MSLEEIRALWKQHEQRPYPLGHRSQKFFDRNLTTWDTETGGLILAFVETGKLGARQYIVMTQIQEQLPQVVDQLEGEGKEYFAELLDIVKRVMQMCPPERP